MKKKKSNFWKLKGELPPQAKDKDSESHSYEAYETRSFSSFYLMRNFIHLNLSSGLLIVDFLGNVLFSKSLTPEFYLWKHAKGVKFERLYLAICCTLKFVPLGGDQTIFKF